MRKSIYPVTIILDRMGGSYSGKPPWVAFPMEDENLPFESVYGGDICQQDFWHFARKSGASDLLGYGESPDEALKDLKDKIKEMEHGSDSAMCKFWKLLKESGYNYDEE